MKKSTLLILTILLTSICSFGQTTPQVIVPTFNDKFSEYVKKLEAGQTDIDYQDFRFSFIDSEQFKIAKGKTVEFDSLETEMRTQLDKSNSLEVIKIATQLLSIDYTNMLAHKILGQIYKTTGDASSAEKHQAIQLGLLNSIIKKGDGKYCETGWTVIQIEEEFFILETFGAKLLKQTVETDDGFCDKMVVEIAGKKKTYFFETSKVLEGYKKLETR